MSIPNLSDDRAYEQIRSTPVAPVQVKEPSPSDFVPGVQQRIAQVRPLGPTAVAAEIKKLLGSSSGPGQQAVQMCIGELTQEEKDALDGKAPEQKEGDAKDAAARGGEGKGEARSEEKPAGDKKTGDKKTGDKKTGDKKADDKQAGDKQAGDKKTEAKDGKGGDGGGGKQGGAGKDAEGKSGDKSEGKGGDKKAGEARQEGGGSEAKQGVPAQPPPAAPTAAPADQRALIEEELAYHERWSAMSAASSPGERAALVFSGKNVGNDLYMATRGAGIQVGMALGIKALATKFPVPGLSNVIGGALSFHYLCAGGWDATWQEFGNIGKGGSIWEKIANTISGIKAIIELIGHIANILSMLAYAFAGIAALGGLLSVFFPPLASLVPLIPAALNFGRLCGGIGTAAIAVANIISPLPPAFRLIHVLYAQQDPIKLLASEDKFHSEAQSAAANYAGAAVTQGITTGGKSFNPVANIVGDVRSGVKEAASSGRDLRADNVKMREEVGSIAEPEGKNWREQRADARKPGGTRDQARDYFRGGQRSAGRRDVEQKQHESQKAADEAAAKDNEARTKDSEAKTRADEATQKLKDAEQAQRDASEAKQKADEAKSVADEAQQKADEARQKADEAKGKADEANQERKSAEKEASELGREANKTRGGRESRRGRQRERLRERARDIREKAQAAKSEADEAMAEAKEALDEATAASQRAGDAHDNARQSADDAASAARDAQDLAGQAQQAAQEAQTLAQQSRSEADQARQEAQDAHDKYKERKEEHRNWAGNAGERGNTHDTTNNEVLQWESQQQEAEQKGRDGTTGLKVENNTVSREGGMPQPQRNEKGHLVLPEPPGSLQQVDALDRQIGQLTQEHAQQQQITGEAKEVKQQADQQGKTLQQAGQQVTAAKTAHDAKQADHAKVDQQNQELDQKVDQGTQQTQSGTGQAGSSLMPIVGPTYVVDSFIGRVPSNSFFDVSSAQKNVHEFRVAVDQMTGQGGKEAEQQGSQGKGDLQKRATDTSQAKGKQSENKATISTLQGKVKQDESQTKQVGNEAKQKESQSKAEEQTLEQKIAEAKKKREDTWGQLTSWASTHRGLRRQVEERYKKEGA